MNDRQWLFSAMGCFLCLVYIFGFATPYVVKKSWRRKKSNPKKYIVQAFDSNQQMEDYINEVSEHFEAVSISDTNRCITVLLRRKD